MLLLKTLIAHSTLNVLISTITITRREWTRLHITFVEINFLETQAKTSFHPDTQNKNIQEKNLNNAPVRRIANAINTISVFTDSYTENPFWYQQFDLTQLRLPRVGQSTVYFNVSDNCRLSVTTMKALTFQDDIPSVLIDKFKDFFVLVFDLTSMPDAIENRLYPKLIGGPPLYIKNPAKCRVSIAQGLQTLAEYWFLQTLSVVKSTIASSSTTNR